MSEKRSDLTPVWDAVGNVFVEIVRFGLDQIEPAAPSVLTVGPIEPGLLNREQAAEYLGIGTSTFDQLRKAKAFPELRIGGKPRWRLLDLKRYALKLKPEE